MRDRHLTTTDAVRLTYRVVGPSPAPATLFFLGGLGGTHLVWAPLVKALRSTFQIVIWDYPGLSAGAVHDDTTPVEITDLARYQLALMDSLHVEQGLLVGWSLGPQVAIELCRDHRDRVSGIVCICGVAGVPFDDDPESQPILAALNLRSSVPLAIGWISDRIERIEKLKSALRRIDHPTRWAIRLGLIDPGVDELIFDAVIRDFLDIHPGTYRRYLEAAARHDARDLLPNLDVPTLLFSGIEDRLIPPRRVETVAQAVPNAEHFPIKGATHFLPLEYPDMLALQITDFLERRVLG